MTTPDTPATEKPRTARCDHCGADTRDHLALCPRCQTTLSVALVNTAAYFTDVARIRPGERLKVRGTYQSAEPTNFSTTVIDPIGEALDDVANTITTWCRAFINDRPNAGYPPRGTPDQCGWLENHRATISTLEWADQLLRDALAAERKLQRILDQADTGWYAGRCNALLEDSRTHDGTTCACACHNGRDFPCDVPGGCGSEVRSIAEVRCPRGLYASPGHSWIRCPECGTTHNAADRRDQMIREARNQNAPVSAIARAVVGLLDTEQSVERLTNRIDQWVSRGDLRSLGEVYLPGAKKPAKVYRIGDVFDLLERRRSSTSASSGTPKVATEASENVNRAC